MYRSKVFEEVKNELITKFQQIELSDFEMYHEWATPHYELLKQLAGLSSLHTSERTEIPEQEKEASIPVVENEAPYPIGHIFTIDKKALGAVISGLSYPIPEIMVRDMGIENGNKVKIIGHKGYFQDGSPKWEFEIVDFTSTPAPGLIEISQGIVKKISHTFIIDEVAGGGAIWVNDVPATLYINETDALKHNIQEGDIVDGRFYENNVTGSFRVTYKHEIEEMDFTQSVKPRKPQYRKNNTDETEANTTMLERLDKQLFLNRHIVLVGLEGRRNDFAANLKGVNEIQLTHLTGDESKATICSVLKKADYVLISTFENSHAASKLTAKTCKEFNIPCTYTHARGLFGVLMDASELIDHKENQVV